MEERRIITCQDCKSWNYNKFPNTREMQFPCGCTVYKGLGKTPQDYCSRGEKDGNKTSG